ncbi:MAG: aldolase/citrate lyase family protein [Acidobacteriota bacterium]|nr:aldolase/citrate lyase family protein [Acidobacteriota bacterium]
MMTIGITRMVDTTGGRADLGGGGLAPIAAGARSYRTAARGRLTRWGLTVVALSGLGGTVLSVQETASISMNRVVTRLTEGQPVVGTFSRVPDPAVDFSVIDAQYGEFDPESIRQDLNNLRVDAPPRLAPVVRIPYDARAAPDAAVDAVLEAGALGVMFPDIETPEQARTAIAAMRYRMVSDTGDGGAVGQRDSGVGTAARYWGLSDDAYRARADVWPLHPSGALVAMLQIESRMGVERVNEILDIPGIGVIFLGPTDLARSIGADGPDAPEVETLVQRVLRACLARDIACGYPIVAPTPEEAERQTARRLREGFMVLAVMTLSQ